MKRALVLASLLMSSVASAQMKTMDISQLAKMPSLTSSLQSVLSQYDADQVREALRIMDQAKKENAARSQPLANPVMDGFKCVKNCSNNTGYVDVVIR